MLEDVEVAESTESATLAWGSDAVAQALRDLDFDYIALNPGASYRGLHDSLVNYLGNRRPQMLVCLHEEHAVALAHGYAKVTSRPMAVALHSNVGLMHGLMAIFNAFADRMPMLILGANGPLDAQKRRPWIDWLHTTADQGALLRTYTKWDDTPGSPGAGRAFHRARFCPHERASQCAHLRVSGCGHSRTTARSHGRAAHGARCEARVAGRTGSGDVARDRRAAAKREAAAHSCGTLVAQRTELGRSHRARRTARRKRCCKTRNSAWHFPQTIRSRQVRPRRSVRRTRSRRCAPPT